ncbi:hypothetical protein COV11_04040 [Candidatus Woesearchaeota archaeon CG10_big_fil_rev_8_21_14_0_10_30_7]|nr:MAG: hypothetical protein COV11_04040 [Candidatus Woesearchaeota archaeon CG10_big_fil_rev_8_21_14_0_10_30_7]
MALNEELVERIGCMVKRACLSQDLKKDLLKILANDDESLLTKKVRCLIRKSTEHHVVPCFFQYLSGNFFIADVSYEVLVGLAERDDQYDYIEKTNIYLD